MAKAVKANGRKAPRAGRVRAKVKQGRRAAGGILYNAVAAAPRRPFGGRISRSLRPMVMDARLPMTPGLPRAVGPYTIIRTTQRHTGTAGKMEIFAPFTIRTSTVSPGFQADSWLPWCGISQRGADADAISAGSTATPGMAPIYMVLGALGEAAEVVPSAITVQVVNPKALQSANGTYFMTRVNQSLPFGGNSIRTWGELKSEIISYYSPRMLAAGKLALRGVKCSGYPLNMSEYSSFAPISSSVGQVQWSGDFNPAAMSPIVFIPNEADANPVEFLITVEWRVRFDPLNPATASHQHHPITSDGAWDGLVKTMAAAGHGVEELTEDVAEIGAFGAGMLRAAPIIAAM